MKEFLKKGKIQTHESKYKFLLIFIIIANTIVAWLLGYYVRLENQYRDNALQLANVDELT